jgi:urea transport system ATP-binding protein
MTALLQLSAVEASVGGSKILNGVDLNVGASEVVVLLGRYGSGRTATLRAIAGVLPVQSGEIFFGGRHFTRLSPDARARAGLSYVPQEREIFPLLTVEENLRLSLVVHHRTGALGESSLERIFVLFPVLKSLLRRKGGSLSIGQQQQLAIGRAILTDPLFLILDEPTEGILESPDDRRRKRPAESFDHDYTGQICHAIKMLKEEDRIAILLVDRDIDFCREIADRFYVMERGAIVAGGPIGELSDDLAYQHTQA